MMRQFKKKLTVKIEPNRILNINKLEPDLKS